MFCLRNICCYYAEMQQARLKAIEGPNSVKCCYVIVIVSCMFLSTLAVVIAIMWMDPTMRLTMILMLLGLGMCLKVLLFNFYLSWNPLYVLLAFFGPGHCCKFQLLALLLLTLILVSVLASASPMKNDFSHCEKIVKKWAFASLEEEATKGKHTLRDLLFFLHVPRTGGRTYFHW